MDKTEEIYNDLMRRLDQERPTIIDTRKMHLFKTKLEEIEPKNIEHGREIASELRDIHLIAQLILGLASASKLTPDLKELTSLILHNLGRRREALIEALVDKVLK